MGLSLNESDILWFGTKKSSKELTMGGWSGFGGSFRTAVYKNHGGGPERWPLRPLQRINFI